MTENSIFPYFWGRKRLLLFMVIQLLLEEVGCQETFLLAEGCG